MWPIVVFFLSENINIYIYIYIYTWDEKARYAEHEYIYIKIKYTFSENLVFSYFYIHIPMDLFPPFCNIYLSIYLFLSLSLSIYIYIYIYIYIIIIIIKCWKHGIPWLSLAIHPNHPSFFAGLLDCIQCLHKADICKSLLVSLHWRIYVSR